jgi:glycosyl transferase family 25
MTMSKMRGSLLVGCCVIICAAVAFVLYLRNKYVARCKLVDVPQFDVYFVNMKSASDRLAVWMKRYLATDLAQTHSPIRVDAVDGKKINISKHVTPKALRQILQSERLGYRKLHYELTRGAIGCFLSHRKIYEQLLESDAPAALIFEDDAIIAKDIGASIQSLKTPADTDILLLGYFCNSCRRTSCGVARARKFFGTHAYIITRAGAEKLLRRPEMWTIGKQIDALLGELSRNGNLNIYATMKQYAVQDANFPTSIQLTLREQKNINPWDETL